ncbi:MAG: aminoacyl-tRNA hydrolase [Rhodospirillales bacterium]|nr:aminoacyl-tRNA hydrolase [Rhodospirillales bacterium]
MATLNGRAVLVGLGNPGAAYAGHRHNIGFMAIDRVAAVHRLTPFRRRFQGDVADGSIDGRPCLALKPLTFMNESGRAVGELCRFYKVPADAVFVFHDDLDIACGRLRVKQGGGHAGHNGLKSLDAHIGPEYWRIRLGIGHPGDKARVHGYVLSDFAAADRQWLAPLLDAVAGQIGILLSGDAAAFTSRIALALRPPAAPAKGEDGRIEAGGGGAAKPREG